MAGSDAESSDRACARQRDQCLWTGYFRHRHRPARFDREDGLCHGGGIFQPNRVGANRLPLHQWRSELAEPDFKSALGSGQQRSGGPAKRQHGLRCHRRGGLFHHAGYNLREPVLRLLVGFWHRAAGDAGGSIERCSAECLCCCVDRGNLRTGNLADSAVDL